MAAWTSDINANGTALRRRESTCADRLEKGVVERYVETVGGGGVPAGVGSFVATAGVEVPVEGNG